MSLISDKKSFGLKLVFTYRFCAISEDHDPFHQSGLVMERESALIGEIFSCGVFFWGGQGVILMSLSGRDFYLNIWESLKCLG